MEEIAATFAGAGLPDGFYRAAGEIYRRLTRYKDASAPPSVSEVVAELAKVDHRLKKGELSSDR
jgi:hypothetical protein